MKKYLIIVLSLLMVLSLAACGGNDSSSSDDSREETATAAGESEEETSESTSSGEPEYIWKIAYMSNEETALYQGIAKFKEELENRLGDRVQIDVYLNGQLGSSVDQTIGGIQSGTIDFCEATLGNVAEYTTAFMPTNLPYLFLNREVAFELVDGEVGDKMVEKYEQDAGVRLLCYWENGYRELTNSKRPITSLADCNGLKIRTMSNPIHMTGISALGINPTPMAWGELFTALQQGTVDGQENPASMIRDQKLYEVQKYMTVTDHFFDFTGLHMNADYYHSLPEDVQQAIDEAAVEAEKYQRQVMAEAETQAVEDLKANPDIEVNELSDEVKLEFREAAKASWGQISDYVDQEWTDMIVQGVEDIEAGK